MIMVIYTNLPNESSALSIGQYLLEKKLIVCTNILPIKSQYIWEEKYCEEQEYGLYLKTNKKNSDSVIQYIKEVHPYEIPYIKSESHTVNKQYKEWMDSLLD